MVTTFWAWLVSALVIVLLAVSHAGYLLGKIPSPVGTPSGGTMQERLTGTRSVVEPVAEPNSNGVAAVPEMRPA